MEKEYKLLEAAWRKVGYNDYARFVPLDFSACLPAR